MALVEVVAAAPMGEVVVVVDVIEWFVWGGAATGLVDLLGDVDEQNFATAVVVDGDDLVSRLVLDIQVCHWCSDRMPPFEGTALPICTGMKPLRQHIQAPGCGLHDRVHGIRAQANELPDAKQRISFLMAASDR